MSLESSRCPTVWERCDLQRYRLHEPLPTFDALTVAYKKRETEARFCRASFHFAQSLTPAVCPAPLDHAISQWASVQEIKLPVSGFHMTTRKRKARRAHVALEGTAWCVTSAAFDERAVTDAQFQLSMMHEQHLLHTPLYHINPVM